MNPDIEKLIRLQRADSELKRAETALADAPHQRSVLDARLRDEKSRLETAKTGLADSQKERRQHEGALQDLETKRSRYKGQLMEVKTNKEYTAMLHEIETVERDVKAREDLILVEMERAETLQAEVKSEEAALKGVEEQHRAEAKALDEKVRALAAEVERFRAERDLVAKGISEDTLALYERVAKLRGSGVAEVKDEMCMVCHVKLRPQLYVDLKKNDAIVQCNACNRILFYEPPVPVVLHQP